VSSLTKHLYIVGKPVVDFLFIMLELFRYLLRLRRYKRKSVKVGVFRKGMDHFERKFQTEGAVIHQPLLLPENLSDCTFVWYQNIRSAQSMRVTDRQISRRRTDGQTANTALA